MTWSVNLSIYPKSLSLQAYPQALLHGVHLLNDATSSAVSEHWWRYRSSRFFSKASWAGTSSKPPPSSLLQERSSVFRTSKDAKAPSTKQGPTPVLKIILWGCGRGEGGRGGEKERRLSEHAVLLKPKGGLLQSPYQLGLNRPNNDFTSSLSKIPIGCR